MVNEKKFCFVTCMSDKDQYSECLRYIQSLYIPEGFQLEVLYSENESSVTSFYNSSMSKSDAKYKIYLHEDVLIINKNILLDLLNLFLKHQEIGLIGVTGAKTVPANGKWWDSIHKCGKVYENFNGKMELSSFNEINGDYESVKCVDGLILATQYDIKWREDIFKGKHFYDISQCLEYAKAGYVVAIPKQDTPWCIHDCSQELNKDYEMWRKIFLEVYSKEIYPLVSILIPTYNRPHYFKLALESALRQTYKNIEVVICDDSTNEGIENAVKEYLEKYNNIRFYKNEKNLGQFENDLKLFSLAQGEYINYLMDDDIFHEDKIMSMMNFFIDDVKEEIKIVTSVRKLINQDGNEIPNNTLSKSLFKQDTIINGIDFGNYILQSNHNCIGEPTTPLFRKKDLKEPFGVFNGRRYGCNVDLATWLNLLSEGKIVYIIEPLSYFRIHTGQQLATPRMKALGAADYAHEILTCTEKGFLKDPKQKLKAIKFCMKYVKSVLDSVSDSVEQDTIMEVEDYYNKLNEMKLILCSDLPLVSVIIPAYNRPHYLEIALNSVLNQTYENIEIIIGDDSTNNDVQNLLVPYMQKYKNIRYYRNEHNLGQFDNDLKLFDLANGEFINYLMDDDVFHEDKIFRMMNYFIADKDSEIKLITSRRKLIDENGKILPDNQYSSALFKEDTLVDGLEIGNLILKCNYNCIGEPTTVLFRKSALKEHFGTFCGRKYGCNVDVATWLNLLSEGKMVYISEPLSYFRIHKGQQLNSTKMKIAGALDYAHEVLNSREKGFLHDKASYIQAVNCCMKYILDTLESIGSVETNNISVLDLRNSYEELKNEVPLVSIMIPTHNRPHYLEIALKSALAQTYPNIEILISDNSDDETSYTMLQPYLKKYSNIKYYRKKGMSVGDNCKKCFYMATGEYINFLMDDDAFSKDKIEKMMYYYWNNNDVTLVTSYRQWIDENGNKLSEGVGTRRLFEKDTILDGVELGNFIVSNMLNVIGEPTTVLIRKKDLDEKYFGYYYNKQYSHMADVATWLHLLSKGKAVYISECLSYFRIHQGQLQKNVTARVIMFTEWLSIIKSSYNNAFYIQSKEEYRKVLSIWLRNVFSSMDVVTYESSALKDDLFSGIKYAVDQLMMY